MWVGGVDWISELMDGNFPGPRFVDWHVHGGDFQVYVQHSGEECALCGKCIDSVFPGEAAYHGSTRTGNRTNPILIPVPGPILPISLGRSHVENSPVGGSHNLYNLALAGANLHNDLDARFCEDYQIC